MSTANEEHRGCCRPADPTTRRSPVSCPACGTKVNRIACPSCEIEVLDMQKPDVAERAKQLGIRSLPAIAVDGKLAGCCAGRGPDEDTLRAAGVGAPK